MKTKPPRRPELTTKQVSLLECLTDGLQDKAIADRLGWKRHALRKHFHRLFMKFSVHNRVGLAAAYMGRTHVMIGSKRTPSAPTEKAV